MTQTSELTAGEFDVLKTAVTWNMNVLNDQISSLAKAYPILNDTVFTVQYKNGRMAGVVPFMFTWAIVADFDDAGYKERWCYDTLLDAIGALRDWDGDGEPVGWHRHPNSGRRRSKEGVELGVW